jgi:hypothetical protein
MKGIVFVLVLGLSLIQVEALAVENVRDNNEKVNSEKEEVRYIPPESSFGFTVDGDTLTVTRHSCDDLVGVQMAVTPDLVARLKRLHIYCNFH